MLAQFLVALVVALGISALFTESGLEAVVVPCLLLWAQLWAIGLLNEGRGYAVRIELFRLLLVVPAGTALQGGVNWTVVIAYLALSLAWLAYGVNQSKQLVKETI